MFLFGGGRKNSSVSEVQILREQHREDLKSVPQVKEVAQDIFDAPCVLPTAIITIRVSLPPGFPTDAPFVKLLPAVVHPWLNGSGVVTNFERLSNWSVHTRLSGIITDIQKEFLANPPQGYEAPTLAPPRSQPGYPTHVAPQGAPPYPGSGNNGGGGGGGGAEVYSYPVDARRFGQTNSGASTYPYNSSPGGPPNATGLSSSVNPTSTTTSGGGGASGYGNSSMATGSMATGNASSNRPSQQVVPRTAPTPVIPSHFPLLDTLSVADLETLEGSDSNFIAFFNDLPEVKQFVAFRLELKRSNEELARANLKKEAEVDEARAALASEHDVLSDQRQLFEELLKQQKEVLNKFSAQNLANLLGAAAEEADVRSMEIRDSFFNGQLEHDKFVKEYLESRTLYHLRAAKKEKLELSSRHAR